MAVSPPPGSFVFLGGGAGALIRAGLELVYPDSAVGLPVTTLAINLSGAFALGLLLRWLALRGPDSGRRRVARLGLGTGVLGGYTTYSSFAVQDVRLMQQGHVAVALAYLAVSLVGGFCAAWAGVALAKRIGPTA